MNRQITMALASPSIPLDSAQPDRAAEPAARPASSPTAASPIIHTRLTQASRCALRAALSQCVP